MANNIDRYQSFIASVLDRLEKSTKEIHTKVLEVITSNISKLVRDGRLSSDSSYWNIINKMGLEIDKIVAKKLDITNIVANFDEIESYSIAINKEINNINIGGVIKDINGSKLLLIQQVEDMLNVNGIKFNYTQPIKQWLLNSVTVGKSYSKALEELKTLSDSGVTVGNTKVVPLQRYATQVCRDAYRLYNGQIQKKTAEVYAMNGFIYTGSLVADSRPICIVLSDRKYTLFSELQGILDRTSKEGMYPNTNKDNFIQYCGGYQCDHLAYATEIKTKNV